jgi:NitT/TauT family transport system ATP-binding protein
MAFLEIRDVTKTFAAGRRVTRALEPVSCHVAAGEFVTFIGPSGCGKSTLLHIIDGLIEPSSGEVRFDGRVVRGPGPDRGMVFQEFALLPWRTVRANVELGPEIQGMPLARRRQRADDLLRLVGLQGFGDRYPRELSGCSRTSRRGFWRRRVRRRASRRTKAPRRSCGTSCRCSSRAPPGKAASCRS